MFFRAPDRARESARILNHDKELVFAVTASGDHIFLYQDAATLLSDYRELITRIRFALDAPSEVWSNSAFALIKNLASTVSSLPASEAVHDPDCGGLFRHSLLTALNALNGMENVNVEDGFRARLCVFMLALMHDLGKPLSDYEVRSHNGRLWDPLGETLDDFMRSDPDGIILVRFIKGRRRSHTSLRFCMALLLFRDNLKALSYIKPYCVPEELFDLQNPFASIVREADSYSAYSQSSRGNAIASLPDYLRADLASRALAGQIVTNTKDSEVFACAQGMVITGGSNEIRNLRAMVRNLNLLEKDSEFEAPNANPILVTSGFYELKGPRRFLSWYRVDLNDESIYVRGAMVRMSVPDELNNSNITDRGIRPPELDEILRAYGQGKDGDLSFIRFDCIPPVTGYIDPKSVIVSSLRYDSHEIAPLNPGAFALSGADADSDEQNGLSERLSADSKRADADTGVLTKNEDPKVGSVADTEQDKSVQDGELDFLNEERLTGANVLKASRSREGLRRMCAMLLRKI